MVNASVSEVSDINYDDKVDILDILILIDMINGGYDVCEIYWGEETGAVPEFYHSLDVDSIQINQVREYYNIAKNAWGNFGPLEFWIIGTDVSDASELDEMYCELRIVKDPCLSNQYLQWCLNREYNFTDYANYGGAGLSLTRDEQPNCDSYSYMQITLSSQYPFPNETDYNVVTMHEYFHAYQHAHIFTYDYELRAELMVINPWWSEGGAEYMAQLLYSQQDGVSENYLRNRMSWKMQSKNDLLENELISEIEYGERGYIAYDLGSWAVAYLISITDIELYLNDFYDSLNNNDWENSFTSTFGMNSAEFLIDFHQFLDLSLQEQLNILP